MLRVVELCAGGGGQALGLERAGFEHTALVEIDRHSCTTLSANRPHWNVIQGDIRDVDLQRYRGVDLLAAGLPCPPFSKAGKQLGESDERNLFPDAFRIIEQLNPRAVMIENVRGLLDAVFEDYRLVIAGALRRMGYVTSWHLFNACDFGVPQLRPRVIVIAIKNPFHERFVWPAGSKQAPTVGVALSDLMESNGWTEAAAWAAHADDIAPTIVGGSKKHGGPDLGPTRARRAWEALGVDGRGVADAAPASNFVGIPRLTCRMVARIQGFPDSWEFAGGKTAAYRQIGNALPPPVAEAVGRQISYALTASSQLRLAI